MPLVTQTDKIIWILWFQGPDHAPVLVQQCIQSWKQLNPDWKVIVLDETTLTQYVDIHPVIARNIGYITPQARSNVVRINLLQQYGGVWVDATCFCCRPLSDWLPELMESGFFVFRDPGPDRVMSNWFIASEQGNPLTAEVCQRINTYWQDNTFSGMSNFRRRRLRTKLTKFTKQKLSRNRIWFSWVVRKGLKVFPLFWFHYLFQAIVTEVDHGREIWERTPYRAADPIHSVQYHGQLLPINEEIRARILNKIDPLYKLSWKRVGESTIPRGSALDYLFSQISGHPGARADQDA